MSRHDFLEQYFFFFLNNTHICVHTHTHTHTHTKVFLSLRFPVAPEKGVGDRDWSPAGQARKGGTLAVKDSTSSFLGAGQGCVLSLLGPGTNPGMGDRKGNQTRFVLLSELGRKSLNSLLSL
jgi:hypothetical protein